MATDERTHEVTLEVLGENKVERARMSRICLYGKFFDYPLKLKSALLQLPFPVLVDQTNEWTGVYLQDPQAATPINMLIDANGNIRWKSEGEKVGLNVLRTQINAVLNSPYEVP